MSEPIAKLLIVDDEAAQMKALCDTLREMDFETTGFVSADQALAKASEQRFDLLLTDLMMPGMDGITLLRKAQEQDPHLVGIVMTGHGSVDTAVEAMKAGALDYILKPFKLSEVLPVINRALGVRQLRIENEKLAQDLAKRTSELEMANKELEAFSYSVSHDLRGPLRAIDGFSQIVLDDYGPQIPEPAKQMVEKVCGRARHMQQLIQDLLSFSRLGREPVSRSAVDMQRLAQDVLDELSREREGRNLEIRNGPLHPCEGDRALLKQVLLNLLSNAFKFTRSRERAVVEIGSERREDELVYHVRDNGVGFDMKYAEKLFAVFQRLHSADQFEGTGIGLSIVQRIIHRHGGRVWAESKQGEGAVFYFSLPAA